MKYRVQNEVAAQMNSWRARRHMDIAVGQWLVSGLHWSSSARQSLAAQQKELSE